MDLLFKVDEVIRDLLYEDKKGEASGGIAGHPGRILAVG